VLTHRLGRFFYSTALRRRAQCVKAVYAFEKRERVGRGLSPQGGRGQKRGQRYLTAAWANGSAFSASLASAARLRTRRRIRSVRL
jgi:hypothetical protein